MITLRVDFVEAFYEVEEAVEQNGVQPQGADAGMVGRSYESDAAPRSPRTPTPIVGLQRRVTRHTGRAASPTATRECRPPTPERPDHTLATTVIWPDGERYRAMTASGTQAVSARRWTDRPRATCNSWPLNRPGLRARRWIEATDAPTPYPKPKTLTPQVSLQQQVCARLVWLAGLTRFPVICDESADERDSEPEPKASSRTTTSSYTPALGKSGTSSSD